MIRKFFSLILVMTGRGKLVTQSDAKSLSEYCQTMTKRSTLVFQNFKIATDAANFKEFAPSCSWHFMSHSLDAYRMGKVGV